MKRSAGTKRAGVAAAGLSTASVSGTNLVRVTRVNCDAEWGRGGPGVRRARGARSGGPAAQFGPLLEGGRGGERNVAAHLRNTRGYFLP